MAARRMHCAIRTDMRSSRTVSRRFICGFSTRAHGGSVALCYRTLVGWWRDPPESARRPPPFSSPLMPMRCTISDRTPYLTSYLPFSVQPPPTPHACAAVGLRGGTALNLLVHSFRSALRLFSRVDGWFHPSIVTSHRDHSSLSATSILSRFRNTSLITPARGEVTNVTHARGSHTSTDEMHPYGAPRLMISSFLLLPPPPTIAQLSGIIMASRCPSRS